MNGVYRRKFTESRHGSYLCSYYTGSFGPKQMPHRRTVAYVRWWDHKDGANKIVGWIWWTTIWIMYYCLPLPLQQCPREVKIYAHAEDVYPYSGILDDIMTWPPFPYYCPFVRKSPISGIFPYIPAQGISDTEFDSFFVISLELLNEQSSCQWFDMPWR